MMAYKFWAPIILAIMIALSGGAGVAASGIGVSNDVSPVTGATVSTATGVPDLIVDSITLSPENPSVGDKATFTVTIKNQGSEYAGSSRVHYYIGDDYLTSAPIDSLVAGASFTMTVAWEAQAGAHAIKAIADSEKDILESDELNNEFMFAFSVLAPDLIIEEISWSPETASVQEKVAFTVTIKNQGNKKSRYSYVGLYIDGASRGSEGVQALEPGDNVSMTFNWITQTGLHEIRAVADILNQVVEGDESNNTRTADYSILAPDLVIQSITRSPTAPLLGADVTFTVTVKNQGSGNSYASQVAYYIDGSHMDVDYIGALAAGGTVVTSFVWEAESDNHTVMAVADAGNKVDETDETNNTKTESIPAMAPDLIIQSITWSPSTLLPKHYMTFTVTIKNQGYIESNLSRLYFNIDSVRYYSYISKLEVGATTTESFSWVAQAGSHTITAIADAEGLVSEGNESNNSKSVTVSSSYPTSSDLVVQNITWSPELPVARDTVNMQVTIGNQGIGRAGWSIISLYIDDICMESSAVDPVVSGGTIMLDFSLAVQPGQHEIKAIADSDERLEETNEDNNIKTASMSVLAPDLFVSDITWAPVEPAPGDTVDFTITFMNRGNYKSGSSYAGYYINDSYRGDHYIEELEAGATVEKTFSYVAPEGPYVIRTVADIKNEVLELDETDNEKLVNFPLPDLVVGAITWSPVSPVENEIVTIDIAFGNEGGATAQESDINCYIDDSFLSSSVLDGLETGVMLTKTFTWTAQSGSHVIKIVADEDNRIVENNESNNEIIATTSVSTAATASLTTLLTTPVIALQEQDAVFDLYSQSSPAVLGEDIVINLSAFNPESNPDMTVELILEVPSVISINSPEFSKVDEGHYTASYNVASGIEYLAEVRLATAQEGNHDIKGYLNYYFAGDKSKQQSQVLSLPITIGVADSQAVASSSATSPEEEAWFSGWLIQAVVGSLATIALAALLIIIKRRRFQHKATVAVSIAE